jgi:uncharacterized protein YukE
MSNDAFSVNTDGLHEQMPYMQELAMNIRSVGTNLQARLDELGDCWGGDATGQQFITQYGTPRDQILGGVSDVGDVLDSTSQGIDTMAVQFDRLEQENIAVVRQLTPSNADGGGSDSDDLGPRADRE